MKKIVMIFLLLVSASGYGADLSLYLGQYEYTGAGYDPRSQACPNNIELKQVSNRHGVKELVLITRIPASSRKPRQMVINNIDMSAFDAKLKSGIILLKAQDLQIKLTTFVRTDGLPFVDMNFSAGAPPQYWDCDYNLSRD